MRFFLFCCVISKLLVPTLSDATTLNTISNRRLNSQSNSSGPVQGLERKLGKSQNSNHSRNFRPPNTRITQRHDFRRRFLTDPQIARRGHRNPRAGLERELEPFDFDRFGEVDDNVKAVLARGFDPNQPREDWDQFTENEKKFGIVLNDYNESEYTVPLDTTAPDFEAQMRRAEQLATEIRKGRPIPRNIRAAALKNASLSRVLAASAAAGQGMAARARVAEAEGSTGPAGQATHQTATRPTNPLAPSPADASPPPLRGAAAGVPLGLGPGLDLGGPGPGAEQAAGHAGPQGDKGLGVAVTGRSDGPAKAGRE